MNIDDLPEALFVEVLCRLPCYKFVFQCKCVSKRWLNLISAPHFNRYLRLQTPILSTLVIFDRCRPSDIFLSSAHPIFKSISRNFSLGFLPCYQNLENLKQIAFHSIAWRSPSKIGSLVPPVVVDTYKDLVLCCATVKDQRDYFICNPFTKQWAALPPTPQVYPRVRVALVVCEPYYFSCKEEHPTSSNVEYSWKVVRLVSPSMVSKFSVEIFSSESRTWTELTVKGSRSFRNCGDVPSTFVFYNGMLYWYMYHGYIMELDLDHTRTRSGDHHINMAKCRFIRLPKDLRVRGQPHLVVNGGRLHLFLQLLFSYHNVDDSDLPALKVWELKRVAKQHSKFEWLANRVVLTSEDEHIHMVIRSKAIESFFSGFEVYFLKNNEDIAYFKWKGNIFTCNFRGGKLEIITSMEYTGGTILHRYNFPLVLPWWPTPVPSL